MKSFKIIADSTCDLSAAFQQEFGVEVLLGHLVFPGKKEIASFLEWKDYTRDAFYADLKKNPDSYATSPPNITEFETAFEKAITEGLDVLCLTISSGISGTYNFAVTARKNVLQKHPEADIRVIDTMRFGPGFGLMTVHAATLRNEGQSLAEVADFIEANKNRYHQAGWLDDLSFVAKKGRLTNAKAFFGTLAGIKPIGEFDYNGMTTVLGKAKGTKAAYKILLKYMEATIEAPEEQIIFIAQTNRYAQAEQYKTMIEEKFHPKAVYINDVFPSCGVNVGPGLMAAYYVGKPISKDLGAERELIERFVAEK